MQLRKALSYPGHLADEIDQVVAFAIEAVPVDPACFVILAIGVVVAGLRVGDFVAGQDQRHASWFFRSWRRSAVIVGSSVGPSWPQLVLWFSLAPSRLSSRLASLCFSL